MGLDYLYLIEAISSGSVCHSQFVGAYERDTRTFEGNLVQVAKLQNIIISMIFTWVSHTPFVFRDQIP